MTELKNKVVLISCVSKKIEQTTSARLMYQSIWFNKARSIVERDGAEWFILSAHYGLLLPDTVISPYNKTLNNMPLSHRKEWAVPVAENLMALVPPSNEIVFLAGTKYREFIVPTLEKKNYFVTVPMLGLKIGHQLQWLGQQ